MSVPKPKSYYTTRRNKLTSEDKITKIKNPFFQDAKVNKLADDLCLQHNQIYTITVHLKVHLMEYEKHDFGLTQTNITNVTVNYIVLDSQKFSENVNVWQAVLQKPYNI